MGYVKKPSQDAAILERAGQRRKTDGDKLALILELPLAVDRFGRMIR